MKKILNILKQIFGYTKVENKEIRFVEICNQPRIYAFGFKDKDRINYRYFTLKYKILKEGNIKQLSLYVDHIEKLNKLTYKNWILVVKEKA